MKTANTNNLKSAQYGGGSVPGWSPQQNINARALMAIYRTELSKAGAAAVIGNQMQESGLNPAEHGGGLSQWIGDRAFKLRSFANSIGQPADSLEAQAKFTLHELKTGYPNLYAHLKTANNPGTAAIAISTQYERPAAWAANLPARKSYAVLAFQHIAGGGPLDSTGTAGTPDTTRGGGGAPGSILDILTADVGTIGGWIASIAFTIVKDTGEAFVDLALRPFWHWNQEAVASYTDAMLKEKPYPRMLWNAAFWGFGYAMLFTDPDQGNLKPAPVRRSRLARHARRVQSLPARFELVKPKDVAKKTPTKPKPVASRAVVTQTGTMAATRTQSVKVTGTHATTRGSVGTESEARIERAGARSSENRNRTTDTPGKPNTEH